MTTSNSPSNPAPAAPSADDLAALAGSPLLPNKPRGRSNKKPLLVTGAVALVALLAGAAYWLLKGPAAATSSVAYTLPADPEPPIAPPAAHDWVKANPAEVPSGELGLEKSLAALLLAAGNVSDQPARQSSGTRAERWEIRFPAGNTIDTYGVQLDLLGIELGAIGGDDTIHYASNFKRAKPPTRDGPGSAEHRMYMTWHSGALRDLDASLMARAGVTTSGRIVAQFFSPDLESLLADLEKQFANKHEIADVRRTIFGFAADGNSLEVVEQEYFSGEVKEAPPPVAVKAAPPAVKVKPAPVDKPAPNSTPGRDKPKFGGKPVNGGRP